jgi:hypothetical protein
MGCAGISPKDVDEFARAGTEDFKKNVKFTFGNEKKEYPVHVSNAQYNNSALKTRRGRMALLGYVEYRSLPT